MNKKFLLSNTQVSEPFCVDSVRHKVSNLSVYTHNVSFYEFDGIKFAVDGYVLPRYKYFNELKHFGQQELIGYLYKKFGNGFVNRVKGIFCVIIITDEQVKIFTDQNGIYKLFYLNENSRFICSNSVKHLFRMNIKRRLNPIVLGVKSLLNHEVNGETVFNGINYTLPATEITINSKQINFRNYYDPGILLNAIPENKSYLYFADFIKELTRQYNFYLKPGDNVISLTGGKDSRTLLTGLLVNGILPKGITYGNPESKDSVYAALIAEKSGIDHFIFNPDNTNSWYEKTINEIVDLGNPLVNIHRAHRYNGFKKMSEIVGSEIAYYGGYLGGELLMGIYYDNLVFTDYLTKSWDRNIFYSSSEITKIISNHFIDCKEIIIDELIDKCLSLRTFDFSLKKFQREFFGIFEIGILHHSQDIFLAKHFYNYPIPLFIDIDFLSEIFKSYYSFLFRDNKTHNLIKRHKLFEFNLNIQHILSPSLDKVAFAKKGSYNTTEFLRGSLYWAIAKSFRYITDRRLYPSNYAYNVEYKNFLVKWLNEIQLDKTSEIHEFFDVKNALDTINNFPILEVEQKLIPYSTIVMYYLQMMNYSEKCTT